MSSPDLTLLYFHYSPSLAAAAVGFAVFALIDMFMIFRYITQKAPAIMFKLIPLASVAMLGYILRLVCIESDITIAKFFIMNLCLLLSPNILALMNYNTVTEIIALSNLQSNKPYLNPKKLNIFFTVCTITSSILQATGGGFQINTNVQEYASDLTIAGLSLQLGVFATFSVLLVYVTCNRSIQYEVEGVKNPKRGALIRIYICLSLMALRIVYRLALFASGYSGVIATREWTFYCFDFLFVAICFLIYATLNNCFPKRGEEQRIIKDEEEKSKDSHTLNSFQSANNDEDVAIV